MGAADTPQVFPAGGFVLFDDHLAVVETLTGEQHIMAQPTPSGKRPATLGAVAVLLIAALWVPIYARVTPKLGPFPFFYWYQLVLVPAVGVVTWICYLLLRTRPAQDSRSAWDSRPWDGAGGRR